MIDNLEVPLHKVATITMGTSPKGTTYNHEGIGLPLLNGPTEFGETHPHCTLCTTDSKKEGKTGDLIFCVRASTGRMNWADRLYSLGRGVCSIRGETSLDTKFIRYCIEWKLNELLNLASGSIFSHLTKDTIRNFPIPYPESRHKITAILSPYDDLIENNTRRIEILEEMAQTIYRQWFIEFQFPDHENVPMVESELGLIPQGWDIKGIDEVAQLHRGKSYRSENLVEDGEGLPFLNLKNIDREGGFRSDGLKWYDGKFKETQVATSNDIIMALTDMTQERRIVARSARVPNLGHEKYVFSMDLLKIKPDELIQTDFLYALLRYSSFAEKLKEYANGTTVLHLSPSHVQSSKLVLPPSEARQRYAEIAKSLHQQSDLLQKKNTNLRQTRDLLLPRLISGELDVSELNIDID